MSQWFRCRSTDLEMAKRTGRHSTVIQFQSLVGKKKKCPKKKILGKMVCPLPVNNSKSLHTKDKHQHAPKIIEHVLPHPAYSPDIAPLEFHLSQSLQNSINLKNLTPLKDVRKHHIYRSKGGIVF